jgi:O-antigen ligase
MLGTVISLIFSADPRHGTPQIRKFFVFLIVLVIYSTYQRVEQVRTTVLLWGGIAALSAIRSLAQFASIYQKSEEAHANFYEFYVGSRITGFTSHWMTLGGEEMLVLLMLAAFLFFAPPSKWKAAGWAVSVLVVASMTLGFTRSIWLAAFIAGLFLVWFWKRWLVLAAPVLLAGALLVTPVRERLISTFRPHGDTDSNQFRLVVWRTGLNMIEAHPWLGLGPEEINVKKVFDQYVPADIGEPRPSGWYGHLHNIYIQYAAERGIPTMLMMMWLIGKMLYDFVRALRRGVEADRRWVLLGAIAVIIAVLVEGFAEYNLGDSEVLTVFLCSSTFGYVAARPGFGYVAART